MSKTRTERPVFWIIAGANGSGKSSAYDRMMLEAPTGAVWIINPDLLAARIRDQEGLDPLTANLESVRRIERWLEASIMAHQTVGVETVLSTDKYRRLVRLAHRRGFEVRLIYVVLESADLNVERVKLRVAKNGHDVPEDSIRRRRVRSFDQLPWFFEKADRVEILDNSKAEPRLVARKSSGLIEIFGKPGKDVQQAIDRVLRGDLRPREGSGRKMVSAPKPRPPHI